MRAALEKVPGVTSAVVDFETKSAVVKTKGADLAALLAAVDDAPGGDYKAKVKP